MSEKADVARALLEFVDKLKVVKRQYFTRISQGYDNNWVSDVVIESGRKYARVYTMSGINKIENKSITAFVDLNTGDIFKPATYKSPAKHARGNVLSDDNGMSAIDESGYVLYLRR